MEEQRRFGVAYEFCDLTRQGAVGNGDELEIGQHGWVSWLSSADDAAVTWHRGQMASRPGICFGRIDRTTPILRKPSAILSAMTRCCHALQGFGRQGGPRGMRPSLRVCMKLPSASSSASDRPRCPTRAVLMFAVDSG